MENWLKNRVAQRLHDLDLGPVEAATQDGVSLERNYIADIVDGRKRSVRVAGAAELAKALRMPKEYFLYEEFIPSDQVAGTSEKQQPIESLNDINSDKVSVNQLDIRFGMGGGAHYDAPVEATPMSFSRAWIRQFTTAPVDQIFWASGFGDSMYPTIGDGDVVLVDCSQKTPRIRDQIWALNQYGQGMIKRLRSTENGYAILSDNPQVPADSASDGSMEIVGRVVAVVRRL